MHRSFRNPVLPGFYPDPSVCRVGDDYYLITSTFEYFPGVPVFHSRDLVHWRQIGHVLDRPEQLNLDGVEGSQGIYAPTIRHCDGLFYMVTTLRRPGGPEGFEDSNIVVTATDPAGPWSDPVVLVDEPGIIDPSLFFDRDGRAWYVANRRVDEPPYGGYRDIWVQEMDRTTLQLVGAQTLLWNGALKEASAPEAPHIYLVDGRYYLLLSEGGTFHQHAVTIARSERVEGPYQGNPGNPILTHRHLGQDYPITNPGHADLIDTPQGQWWMVALASRPRGGYFYNLGRETFLAPVVWEEGWPIVSPGAGRIEFEHPAPDLPAHPWPREPACDHFDRPQLAHWWNFVRTPRRACWSLSQRPGYLRLYLWPQRLGEAANPACLLRRLQHHSFAARTALEFTPRGPGEEAGLVLRQNDDYHFRFTCGLDGQGRGEVRLVERRGGDERVLAGRGAQGGRHFLKVEARDQDFHFYWAPAPEAWERVAGGVDGRLLSAQVAGGFVGATVGLYASSNGGQADHWAEFDYFEYAPTAL